MKRNVIFWVCMILSVIASGQSKEVEEIKVTPPKFTGIEKVAEIINGGITSSIAEYLVENFRYPYDNGKALYEGTEIVKFVVLPTGELDDYEVINSVSTKIDEELIRVLKTTSGMWKPGFNNGDPVAMEKEVSMVIKLHDTVHPDEVPKFTAIYDHFKAKAEYYFKSGNKKFLLKGNPNRAMKLYNIGIRYLPKDVSLLLMRGLCKYELGDREGARRDWNRLKDLGGIDVETKYFADDIPKLKGYNEVAGILEQE